MSDVKILEPLCYRKEEYEEGELIDVEYNGIDGFSGGRNNGIPLVSIDQAEAYAAAKVREALEDAAKVCDTYFNEITEQRSNPYYDGALDAADILEQRIRALIK